MLVCSTLFSLRSCKKPDKICQILGWNWNFGVGMEIFTNSLWKLILLLLFTLHLLHLIFISKNFTRNFFINLSLVQVVMFVSLVVIHSDSSIFIAFIQEQANSLNYYIQPCFIFCCTFLGTFCDQCLLWFVLCVGFCSDLHGALVRHQCTPRSNSKFV